MPLDGITATFLARELDQELSGARLDRITQPGRNELLFQFRLPGISKQLYLSSNPSLPVVCLSRLSRKNPAQAPAFCMLLRKYLLGAQLLSVKAPDWDRVFILRFHCRDELGDQKERQLILELMGKHSNIILVNSEGIIQDAIRQIDSSLNRFREIMPARPYLPPPAQDKISPEFLLAEAETEDFARCGFRFLRDGKTDDRRLLDCLQKELAGFSPLLCREVLERAQLDERLLPAELTMEESLRLSRTLLALLRSFFQAHEAAVYSLDENGKLPYDYHAVRLTLLPFRKECPSVSAALDLFLQARLAAQDLQQRKTELERMIRQEQKQNARRMQHHRLDEEEGRKSELYLKYAKLLQAQLHLLPERAAKVSVTDYFDAELPSMDIPLQPHLSPARNAEYYYRLYRKAKQKAFLVEDFLRYDEAEAAWLDSLETALKLAENPQDCLALMEELKSQGVAGRSPSGKAREEAETTEKNHLFPGRPAGKKREKRRKEPVSAKKTKKKTEGASSLPLAPRRYLSSDGVVIEVGRNNLQNDRLSLRQARKDWLWFHADGSPGAHVILHSSREDASNQSIEEAAALAAWFSGRNRVREGEKISVNFCPARNLSKAKGARPGQVLYREHENIYMAARHPEHYRTADEHEDRENGESSSL